MPFVKTGGIFFAGAYILKLLAIRKAGPRAGFSYLDNL